MKRFTPSLACFLIVLGQLCLMGVLAEQKAFFAFARDIPNRAPP